VHISGWEIKEMQQKGCRIVGINGCKKLYGGLARCVGNHKLLGQNYADDPVFS